MDFSTTDTQQAIQELSRQILSELSSHEALTRLEAEGRWMSTTTWEALAEAELFGVALPEAVGGGAMGLSALASLLEEVGRAAAPIPLLSHAIASLTMAHAGKLELAEAASSGAARLTVALVDDDPERPTPRYADGCLTGVRACVPSWEGAAAAVVSVDNDGLPGVVLVQASAGGITAEPQTSTTGQPMSHLRFESTPAELLDVPLSWLLQRHYALQSAMQLGAAQAALDLTSTFCTERHQFGVPIGTFQAVGQRAADAYIDTRAMALSLQSAIWRLEQGLDAEREVAIASWWAAEGGHRVSAAAMHLHGGMGFDRDYPLHRYFLINRRLQLLLGGSGQRLERIAPASTTIAKR